MAWEGWGVFSKFKGQEARSRQGLPTPSIVASRYITYLLFSAGLNNIYMNINKPEFTSTHSRLTTEVLHGPGPASYYRWLSREWE